MDIRLLGPIETSLDSGLAGLGPRQQRAVLAMLALQLNRTVSTDRLIEGLWGERAPPSAPKLVQLYVSHLRQLLGAEAEIVTRGRGYELRLAADRVDAARFERLVAEAAAANGPGAGLAREALALWRGPALADVADEPFAGAEIRRLDELRLRATELAIDGELAAGRHRELIGELEALVAAHPLSERLHGQRMLALYRSGRQAEALAAYRHARRVLVDEIGVEPDRELRRLHDAILRQDAALDLPAAVAPSAAVPSPVVAGGRAPPVAARTPGRRVLVAVAALVLVGGLAVFAVGRWSGPERIASIDENAVGLIDPGSGQITAQYPVGRGASALTVGGGSVWVANAGDGTVSRIERGRDQIVTIPVGEGPSDLAFAAGSLWVTDRGGAVWQISPAVNRVVRRIPAGNAPRGIVAGYGALWVASEADRTVTRIGLGRGAVTRRIDLGANPTALAAGEGAVWVTSEEGATVFRIEPRSGTVVGTIAVGNGPVDVAVADGAAWTANRQDATVSRIDPATDTVTDIVKLPRDPSAIAAAEGEVWVTSPTDGSVTRIDPMTRRTQTVAVNSSPSAIAVIDGKVWTAALAAPATHRGGTLRVQADPIDYHRLEPASTARPHGRITALARLRRPRRIPACRRRDVRTARRRARHRRPAPERRRADLRLHAATEPALLRRLARPPAGFPRLTRSPVPPRSRAGVVLPGDRGRAAVHETARGLRPLRRDRDRRTPADRHGAPDATRRRVPAQSGPFFRLRRARRSALRPHPASRNRALPDRQL